MFTEIKTQKAKTSTQNTPSLKMAGIALKRSVRLCFHYGPSRSVFERKEYSMKRKEKKEKKIISKSNKRNAAFSRLLIDFLVTAFRILIKYIGTNFLRMEVFKEFVLDLMLEAVEIIGRF